MAKSTMPEISHSVSIDVELPVAYLALTEPHHVHKWWSADSYVEPFVGGKLKLGALPHDCTLVVDRMESDRLVEWRCVEARSGAARQDDCVGTRVRFLLARNERGGTEVSFSHRGWRSTCECFKAWDSRWLRFAGRSLKSYLETGLGEPAC
ncbi:MAG: SRPBCC domain-containing protein [Acidobacteriales bacterium]|nr:SRPBCC domain-containing protein [Terriglobales bacterium]